MADRFANGLKLTAPVAAQCGRTFCRWLVEWLTRLCGWTIVDAVSGNWSNVVGSGTSGASVTSYPNRLNITGDAYSFDAVNDVGAYVTLTGFTGRYITRNGIYRIRQIISAKVAELEVERSVHEDGFPAGLTGLSWRLWRPTAAYVPDSANVIVLGGTGSTGAGAPYTFHLHITCRATNSYFPEFRMAPFASWNASTHAWNDSKYTAAQGIDDWSSSLTSVDVVRVWGAGDADRAIMAMRVEDNSYAWHMIYLGEIDVKDAAADPKPCVTWIGCNPGNGTPGGDNSLWFGYGSSSTMNAGGRWLAYDDLTTVTGYAMLAHVPPSDNYNWISETYRWWSERTRARYRQPIICECRTTGFMELRGNLRRVWVTNRDTTRLEALGVNGDYLHLRGGLVIPWCNSRAWYERG